MATKMMSVLEEMELALIEQAMEYGKDEAWVVGRLAELAAWIERGFATELDLSPFEAIRDDFLSHPDKCLGWKRIEARQVKAAIRAFTTSLMSLVDRQNKECGRNAAIYGLIERFESLERAKKPSTIQVVIGEEIEKWQKSLAYWQEMDSIYLLPSSMGEERREESAFFNVSEQLRKPERKIRSESKQERMRFEVGSNPSLGWSYQFPREIATYPELMSWVQQRAQDAIDTLKGLQYEDMEKSIESRA